LRGELVAALRRHALTVAYQPIIDLASGCCVGAEALVRWRQADGTFVSPSLFIPLAEDAGLLPEITDQVLTATLRDLGDFLPGRRDIYISINVGAEDLTRWRFLDVLGAAIAGSDIQPDQIRIEATERGFLQASAAQEVIAGFRRAGHPVYIDDFGTGFSSLAYLQTFSVDCLKIDKSFIDAIETEAVTSSVVPHIIDMARTLGLSIVAEGVETHGQASYLQSRGVRYCQGWLFSKALPADEFRRFAALPRTGSATALVDSAA
jgi:sensor c-di-GMP phosphodiesterase-like protein